MFPKLYLEPLLILNSTILQLLFTLNFMWLTFQRQLCSGYSFHAAWRRIWDKGKLQPGWRWLELFENIWEWDPHNDAITCCYIKMDYKILCGNWLEQQINVMASEAQWLWSCLWELYVITSRDRARYSVNSAF